MTTGTLVRKAAVSSQFCRLPSLQFMVVKFHKGLMQPVRGQLSRWHLSVFLTGLMYAHPQLT